jgi:hypothetical protein
LREQHEGLWRNCANSVTHALEHVCDPSQENDSFQHRKWAILSVAHAAVPENIIKTTISFWITLPLYSSLLLNTKPECTRRKNPRPLVARSAEMQECGREPHILSL